MDRVSSLVPATLVARPGFAFAAGPDVDAAKLYDFRVQATPEVAKGAITVTIAPKSGAQIHKEAPTELVLKAPGQVTLAKDELGRPDLKVSGTHATFEVPFDAAAAGHFKVDADLSFYTCTAKRCVRERRAATADVDVP